MLTCLTATNVIARDHACAALLSGADVSTLIACGVAIAAVLAYATNRFV